MKILSKQTDFRLIPDMTGTVEITVGHKLVITYFFYPIAKLLIRASGRRS